MIGRGDLYDVELLLLEHLAEVGIQLRLGARLVPSRGEILVGFELMLVRVAKRGDLDVLDLDETEKVILAVPARAEQRDPAGLAGGSRAREG